MTGWWRPEPPYHAPVFVLTRHGHDPIQMDGGTTFHFVTEGFDAAYSAACRAAGDKGVDIAGGASTVRQALIAGVIDELTLDIAPVLLGSGEQASSTGLNPSASNPPRSSFTAGHPHPLSPPPRTTLVLPVVAHWVRGSKAGTLPRIESSSV